MSTAAGSSPRNVPKLPLRPLPPTGIASPPVSPHATVAGDLRQRAKERQSLRSVFPGSSSNSSSPREPSSSEASSSSVGLSSASTPDSATPLTSPSIPSSGIAPARLTIKSSDSSTAVPRRPTHSRQRSRSGYDNIQATTTIVSGRAGILCSSAKPDPNAEQRQKLLNELLSTEEEYVADLQYIIKNYITELEKREIIGKDVIAKIFSNIPQLAEMHTLLLSEMKARPNAIWEPFVKLHPFFKMYTQYCTNYVTTSDYVVELQQSNPAFAAFLNIVKSSTDKRLSLADYLIKPVQRLCKYPLFFKELRGLVPSGTPEHQRLIEADALMGCAAAAVNESKKKTEISQRLLQLSNRIDLNGKIDELIAPDRELLFEGSTDVKVNAESPVSYITLLFSDIILLCKPAGVLSRKKLEVEQVIHLTKNSSLKEVPAESKDRTAVVLLDGAAGFLFDTEKSSDLSRLLTTAVARCAQRRPSLAHMSPRSPREKEKREKKEKKDKEKDAKRESKDEKKPEPSKEEKAAKEKEDKVSKEKDEKVSKEKEERNRKAALVRSISLRGAVKLPFATQDV